MSRGEGQREGGRERKRQRERERKRESQAGSMLSAEPNMGLDPMTLESQPKPKLRVAQLTEMPLNFLFLLGSLLQDCMFLRIYIFFSGLSNLLAYNFS